MWNIDLNSVLTRSKELLRCDPSTTAKSLKTLKYQFHRENAQTMLRQKSDIIINECSNQTTADLIPESIYRSINPILESTKISIKNVKNKNNEFSTKTCDDSFLNYIDMLNCPSSNNQVITELYDQYQHHRNQLHAEYIRNVNEGYKTVIESKDDKNLWMQIDWSGNLKHIVPKAHPPMNVMSEHFMSLYEPIKDDGYLSTLQSDVYIPLTDDNIAVIEVLESSSQMKKVDMTTVYTCYFLCYRV